MNELTEFTQPTTPIHLIHNREASLLSQVGTWVHDLGIPHLTFPQVPLHGHGLTSAHDLTLGYIWTGPTVLSFPRTHAFLRCPCLPVWPLCEFAGRRDVPGIISCSRLWVPTLNLSLSFPRVQVAMSTGKNVTSKFKNKDSGCFLAIKLPLQKILLSQV